MTARLRKVIHRSRGAKYRRNGSILRRHPV